MKTIEVPPIQFRLSDLAHVRYIIFAEEHMIFDMVLLGERIATLRKWIGLNPETYVRDINSGIKLKLLKVEGLPLSPKAMEYKFKTKSLLFKLYFNLPPKGAEFLDLIEDEKEAPGCISQYRICISESAKKGIKHYFEPVSSIYEIPLE